MNELNIIFGLSGLFIVLIFSVLTLRSVNRIMEAFMSHLAYDLEVKEAIHQTLYEIVDVLPEQIKASNDD